MICCGEVMQLFLKVLQAVICNFGSYDPVYFILSAYKL